MSRMIQCDSCKKLMYEDSRSAKGDYHYVSVDMRDSYYLCRSCYKRLIKEFFYPQAKFFDSGEIEETGEEYGLGV